jgi:uncharacterized membrane protein (DUF485 family)
MTREPRATDLTPIAGAVTDVAPLGRQAAKPPHERTADEDVDVADWERVAALAEFKALLAAKRRFIVPAVVFFIVYYFALPLLVGYAPRWMAAKVSGVVNVAYLFALSQFLVASKRRPVDVPGARHVPRLHRRHVVDHVVGRAAQHGVECLLRCRTLAGGVAERCGRGR